MKIGILLSRSSSIAKIFEFRMWFGVRSSVIPRGSISGTRVCASDERFHSVTNHSQPQKISTEKSSRTKTHSFLYLSSIYPLNKLTVPLTFHSSWFFCKLMTQVRQFPRPNRGSFGKAVPTTVAPMEEPAANPDSIL